MIVYSFADERPGHVRKGVRHRYKEQVILNHLLDGHLGRVVAQSHSIGMVVQQWAMRGISKSF
jgi:hypothetical protein